jgi:hypothetical protein
MGWPKISIDVLSLANSFCSDQATRDAVQGMDGVAPALRARGRRRRRRVKCALAAAPPTAVHSPYLPVPRACFLLAPLALLLLAACNANVEEGCLSSPCEPPGFLNNPVTSSGSTSGTTSGDGCGGLGGAGGGDAGAAGAGGTGGAAGAGGGLSCTDTTDVGDFPCDVFMTLQAKCLICHSNPPTMFAPFPLATYEDTQAPYGMRQRWERMAEVIATDFMPLSGSLNCDEKKLLLDWLNGCAQPAPAGMGCE